MSLNQTVMLAGRQLMLVDKLFQTNPIDFRRIVLVGSFRSLISPLSIVT